MKISVAGAGAGKTTKIAEKIISYHNNLDKHLNIYCIAFTNNAVNQILNKLSMHFGIIPDRIKVSTIHSFLYHEIIKPYYFILFGKQYIDTSNIKLPSDIKEIEKKKSIIRKLEEKNILHIECYSQKAYWVMVKKSTDKVRDKNIRKVILNEFKKYCGCIFIDEAQDIDENVLEIIKRFNELGIDIEIMGDPKQDLKGFGCLRKLMELLPQNVEYIKECHRCPQLHLDISNLLLSDNEKQKASRKVKGELSFLFETDIDVEKFISDENFDLKYISEKNNRYETHEREKNVNKFDNLYYEILECIEKYFSDVSKIKQEQLAYFWTSKLLNIYKNTQNARQAMYEVFCNIRIAKNEYRKIITILDAKDNDVTKKKVINVNSIESIKGKEGQNCLFILTTDLADYLFGKKKNDNKTKNKLYVALTRSLNKLTIIITIEVEKKYGRDDIINFIHSCQND